MTASFGSFESGEGFFFCLKFPKASARNDGFAEVRSFNSGFEFENVFKLFSPFPGNNKLWSLQKLRQSWENIHRKFGLSGIDLSRKRHLFLLLLLLWQQAPIFELLPELCFRLKTVDSVSNEDRTMKSENAVWLYLPLFHMLRSIFQVVNLLQIDQSFPSPCKSLG